MEKFRNLSDVSNRINSNYCFVKELEKLINQIENDEQRLKYIAFVAKLYSEYITGIYSSNFLEYEIAKIGKRIDFLPTLTIQRGKILHVMTRASNKGGHSTIVNNWIRWDSQRQYSVVFTDMIFDDVPSFIVETVTKSRGKVICLQGGYIEKANQLLEVSQSFERIILDIHMYDIIPVLAYSNANWKIPIYFYNHADFRFSLGFSIADVVLNLNKFDVAKTHNFRGVASDGNILLQSPSGGYVESAAPNKDVQDYVISKYNIDRNAKLVVSMGDDYKYEDIVNCKFTDFVERLISKSKDVIQFIIIGPNPEREKWKKLEINTNGCARAIGYIERQEAYCIIKMCNLFIASFPMRSSGIGLAEMWGIPYLSLFLIDREKEFFGENKAESIDELIEKSLEILSGNIEKYKGHCLESTLSQQEWCNQWNIVIEKYSSHKINEFSPKRCIGKQELVNCQLTQETANKNVKSYLSQIAFNKETFIKVVELSEKYEMDIIPEQFNVVDENIDYIKISNLYRKCDNLYLYASKWLKIKQRGGSIAKYLFHKGYRSVAIYGMSYLGENLFYELENSEIIIRYCMDKRAKEIRNGINVIYPSEKIEDVDVMINTSVAHEMQIRNDIKSDIQILSLFKIIDELNEDIK